MKKAIIALLAIIMPLVALANEPEIKLDKINSDGSRYIICSTSAVINKFSDKIKPRISLGVIQIGDSIMYNLSFAITDYTDIHIRENSSLLIRLGNGDVIHLKTLSDNRDSVGRYNQYAKLWEHTIYPKYDISIADLKSMIVNGVTKIRIETAVENIDKDISPKQSQKLVAFLGKEYKLIRDALESKENDITDGF